MEKTIYNSDIFKQGMDDFFAYRDSNPYQVGMPEWKEWSDGWRTAHLQTYHKHDKHAVE